MHLATLSLVMKHKVHIISYHDYSIGKDDESKHYTLGWFKNPLSSQTEKLMAGTKFSDYLGLNHYKKAKKLKHFIHLRLTNRPQSFGS